MGEGSAQRSTRNPVDEEGQRLEVGPGTKAKQMSFQSRNKFQIVAVRARLERRDLCAFFPNPLIQRAGFQRGAAVGGVGGRKPMGR